MPTRQDKSQKTTHIAPPDPWRAFIYLSKQEGKRLAKPQPLEHKKVIGSRHGQHRHPLLLPQHAGRGAPKASQHPAPAPQRRAARDGPTPGPELAVPGVAEQRQQEEERSPDVGPPDHAGHRFGVNGVRGEEKARQQAPRPPAEEHACQGGEEAGDQSVQRHVEQVVAPGSQAVQGVVEAEGEGAERAEGLVAAAVGEQGAPEVIVQDVGPRSLGEEVLVGLDGSTTRSRGGK